MVRTTENFQYALEKMKEVAYDYVVIQPQRTMSLYYTYLLHTSFLHSYIPNGPLVSPHTHLETREAFTNHP